MVVHLTKKDALFERNFLHIHEALYENFKFISSYCKSVEFGVCYGLIASGDMREITKNDTIFNSLQQAYYNIHLMIDGIPLTEQVYEDFIKHIRVTSQDIDLMWSMLNGEVEKGKRTIRFVDKAKQDIQIYQEKQGVVFKEDTIS